MPPLWRKICIYGIPPLAMLIGAIIYQVTKTEPPPPTPTPAVVQPPSPPELPPLPPPEQDPAEPPPTPELEPTVLTTPPDNATAAKQEAPPPPPLTLQLATQTLTTLAGHLSTNPLWMTWLKQSDIIVRFVRMLDDISQGDRPLGAADFLRSKQAFSAVRAKDGDAWVIAPAAAARYDFAIDVFCSLDPDAVAKLYPRLEPALQEALNKLGYRGRQFRELLTSACTVILSTPVVKDDARLVAIDRDGTFCQWQNPELEALNDAQKLFLRLGERNTTRIRTHLQTLAQALDLYADE
ncbi:MAG: DUF3014 domain-containing protein [Lentisphaerae bacterium]|nr:DUF3014 domain-containing protein [Lentisphaerota bacterium]HQL88695.1 DUF3014 domain-containing protein [Lentisphaeria bacterium]